MVEAQLLVDLLQQEGIEVRVLNQYARGAMGEIPFTHAYPELWLLDERDRARAETVLRTLQSAPARGAPRPCRSCGEELAADLLSCWNCGAHQ